MSRKGCTADFDEILKEDEERRAFIAQAEKLKAQRNKVSAEIPALKKAGKPVDGIFAEMREIGELILRLIREGEDAVPAVREEVLALCERFPIYPDVI